jgi:hypothetical protein
LVVVALTNDQRMAGATYSAQRREEGTCGIMAAEAGKAFPNSH